MLDRANRYLESFLDKNLRLIFGMALGYILASLPTAVERYRSFFGQATLGQLLLSAAILAAIVLLVWKATRDAADTEELHKR